MKEVIFLENWKRFKPFIYMAFGIVLYSIINNVGAISNFLGKIFGTVSIFVYGIVISIFLNPVQDYLERHSKLTRIKSILAIYATLLIVVSLLLFLGVPAFLNNIRNLTKEIPEYAIKLNETFSKWAVKIEFFEKVNFAEELTNGSQLAMRSIENILVNTIGSLVKTFNIIANFLIAMILSGFFLAKKEYFINLSKEIISIYFSEKNTVKIYFLGEKLNEVFLGWLHGKTIDSLIIGGLGFTILTILKVPYAVFLGVAIYITNYVPYLGPMVGIMISAIVAFFTTQDKVLLVIVFLIILQQFDAWYLEARCFRKTLKLDLFWGIAAVLFGGSIGGPIWIILMIPTFAFVRDMYLMRKDSKEQEND